MRNETRIILASASPRRRELLSQIGLDFEVMVSQVEEKVSSMLPERVVEELSAQKAEAVLAALPDSRENVLVIGADTVVAFEGTVMGKPKNAEDAYRMLNTLQGNVHQVYTGVTLCRKKDGQPPVFHTFYEKTDVTMYPMSGDEIKAYIATGEPMDKAGAYAIQGGCAAYIQGICGDYSNVVGLPVGRLWQEMKGKKIKI